MLDWKKIDAIPGWFTFPSYCVWRALLDQQTKHAPGDLFEIGVWRGRSASILANYRKDQEKLYLCDLRLDQTALQNAIKSTGVEPIHLVCLPGPSADLLSKLDIKTMHGSVRWLHLDGEHTGTAVYRELEFANHILNSQGIVALDDFFSPRYPSLTTAVIRYLEKNPFHFRLLAVGFNQGYLCRPEALPHYINFIASDMSRALRHYGTKATLFKTTGPWDTDAIGITEYVPDVGPIAGNDHAPQYWQMIRAKPIWGPGRHLQNGFRKLINRCITQ